MSEPKISLRCALCKKELVEIPPSEMPARTAMLMAATGKTPKCNDAHGHRHIYCATPSCKALMPPGWSMCVRLPKDAQ